MDNADNGLKGRILAQMTSETFRVLDDNLENAKEFIQFVGEEGNIEIAQNYELSANEKIELFLLAKRYGQIAGFFDSYYASNQDIQNQLGLKKGTVDSSLKDLFDRRMISKKKAERNVLYSVNLSQVERILKEIKSKRTKVVR